MAGPSNQGVKFLKSRCEQGIIIIHIGLEVTSYTQACYYVGGMNEES